MPVTTPPALTNIPDFPALSDRAAGTYNSKAFAFGSHMADTFNAEVAALASNVFDNATEAQALAVAAGASATAAAGSVTTAAASVTAANVAKTGAEAARDSALVAAAAAGAAAGLPTLVGNSLNGLRVKADETGVEWAELQQLQRAGVFADGSNALTPASSGELIIDTVVNTGLSALTTGAAYVNGLFVVTGPASGVATATNASGPWTLRSFAAAVPGLSPRVGSDGTNLIVISGGNPTVARSTNSTTWTSGTNTPENAGGTAPVGIGGTWLVAASTPTSVYRSTNLGTSWTTETILPPDESCVFKLGSRFCYFNGNNLYHSALGTSADFTAFAHGLGFTPVQITPLPDGTCAFVSPASGAVYIATAYDVFTRQSGIFCPLNHKIWRVNGVWLFTPVGSSTVGGDVQTATHGGASARVAISIPSVATATSVALPFAESGGVTVLPQGLNGVNGGVIAINHAASKQVYFAGA